jgi:hypothetical protein
MKLFSTMPPPPVSPGSQIGLLVVPSSVPEDEPLIGPVLVSVALPVLVVAVVTVVVLVGSLVPTVVPFEFELLPIVASESEFEPVPVALTLVVGVVVGVTVGSTVVDPRLVEPAELDSVLLPASPQPIRSTPSGITRRKIVVLIPRMRTSYPGETTRACEGEHPSWSSLVRACARRRHAGARAGAAVTAARSRS